MADQGKGDIQPDEEESIDASKKGAGHEGSTGAPPPNLVKYAMGSGKKIAVVVNYQRFGNLYQERKGSHHDFNAICEMLTSHSFDIKWRLDNCNYNCEEMDEFFKKVGEEVSEMGWENISCFFCYVSSYGGEGYILGSDGSKIEIGNIIKYFKGDQCESLIAKPKLFFIQACPVLPIRGDEEFYPEGGPEGEDEFRQRIPVEADILLVQSCIAGHLQWCKKEKTSWYVEVLTMTINGGGDEDDILTLLTRANRNIVKKLTDESQPVTLPYISSTLRRDLIL